MPQLGDSFEIMTFGSRIGQFSEVTGLNIGSGLQFNVEYHPTSITLTASLLRPIIRIS